MKYGIHRQLMVSFAAFTLGVSALFGLFAMAFVYTVEDKFMERVLLTEADAQRAYFAANRRWSQPTSDFISLHVTVATLPKDMAEQWRREPRRTEFAGDQDRHYHVLALQQRGAPPLLVAEVSRHLVVRPMRQELLAWLMAWGVVMVGLALGLAWWLARRTSAPLERLAAQVALVDPGRLPERIVESTRDDEVGAVARGLDVLMARMRAFIEREQMCTRDVSHELRNPLATMRIAIERLQCAPALACDPAKVIDQLAAMHAAVILMEQTVGTFLMLAREQPLEPITPTALLPLIEQWALANEACLDRQQTTLDLQITPQDTVALPLPVARLLVANLLGNAVAHGPRGSLISVYMDHDALSFANPSQQVPTDAGRVFVKGEGSAGFGLGLSIVRRLLDRYAGAIAINHQDGITTVCVCLPPRPAMAATEK
jgi:signal transduction histidine kinase